MRRHTAAIWCSVICESGTSNESCRGTRPLATDHFLLLNYPRPLTQGRPDLAGSRSARNLFAQQQFHLLNVWKGSKAELGKVRLMSALPPKADVGTQSRNVCFVPKGDIQARVGYDCAWEDAQARGASLWNFPVDDSCILPRVPPRLGLCYATH